MGNYKKDGISFWRIIGLIEIFSDLEFEIDSKCAYFLKSYHWCFHCSLFGTMRNEDVAEAMKQLEFNFKQHTDAQLAAYTKLLERYMSSTNSRFGQLHQQFHEFSSRKLPTEAPSATKEDHGSMDSPPLFPGELRSSDLSATQST